MQISESRLCESSKCWVYSAVNRPWWVSMVFHRRCLLWLGSAVRYSSFIIFQPRSGVFWSVPVFSGCNFTFRYFLSPYRSVPILSEWSLDGHVNLTSRYKLRGKCTYNGLFRYFLSPFRFNQIVALHWRGQFCYFLSPFRSILVNLDTAFLPVFLHRQISFEVAHQT